MKKLSKLMALLLALVLVLSTGFSAVAETTIDTKDQYFAQAKEALHEFIMGTKTYQEYWAVAKLIAEADFEDFYYNYLTEEEQSAMSIRMEGMFWDSLVAFENAAPFPSNVAAETASVSTYNLRTVSEDYAISTVDETTTENGLILNKTATANDDGSYTVRLETYVTGKVTTTTTTTAVPCDIVLVLDFSKSMSQGFSGGGGGKPGENSTSSDSKIVGLQTAVNNFVQSVNDQYTATANHKMSIISYNANATVQNNWMDVSDANVSTLQITDTERSNWMSEGTQTYNGMNEALTQLNARDWSTTGRQTVVVLFTDGEPTNKTSSGGSTEFNEEIAANAVTVAGTMKDDDVVIYSIAVLSGANPTATIDTSATEDDTKINAMLHAISSNYPDATASASGSTLNVTLGTINSLADKNNSGTIDDLEEDDSYYLTADSATSLNTIFQNISSNIQTGSSSMQLGSTTVINDIITPYFTLPTNATVANIVTTEAAHTGDDGTTPVFGSETATSGVTVSFGTTTNADNTTSTDKKSLNITGFDFASNAVMTLTNNNQTEYKGKKLIITFIVNPEPDFLGGNDVITNTSAGVYKPGDGGALELVEAYPQPDVDVAAKQIKHSVEDQHIYLTNSVDLVKLLGLDVANQYLEYTLNGTKYSVDGVNNAYVDITYTFKDASGNTIATYKIGKGQTTGTLTYATDSNGNLLTAPVITSDTTYTIECLVDAGKKNGVSNSASSSDTATVYVYKPVLTFKDTEEKYDTEMAEASETDYYNAAGNNVVSEVWKHGDTVAADQMTGEKPVLTLTYTATTKTGTTSFDWLNDSRVVYGKEDAYVNVTVWSDGDVDRDITGETTAVRNVCSLAHKDADKCAHASAQTTAAMGNDPEFIVHIYDVYGHLTITKVVEGTAIDGVADSFTFSVELKNKDDSALSGTFGGYTFRDGKASITLKNGESAEIKDLPPESKYTVTETVPVGYTKAESAVNNGTAGVIDAGKTDTLTFTNTYETGSLNVSKTVVGTDAPKSTDAFTFTVTLNGDDGAPLSGTYGGVKFTNGAASFDLKDKETKTLTGLPINATYTVTEAEDPDYTTTKSGETGKISTDAQTAAFTNTYKYASLTITKVAAADTTIGSEETFIFDVKKGDSVISTVVVKGNNGTVTISGLTIGETYTVTEKTDWSWRYDETTYTDSDATTANGTVKLADSGNTVTVTNKKTNNNWIDGEDSVVNTWNENSVLNAPETTE